MHSDNHTILNIKNLVVDYTTPQGAVRAVDQVSLSLKAGECLGIIGESGSGKSSLVLAAMGLIKNGKIQGEIRYKDKIFHAMAEKKFRQYRWKEIALVFQNSLEVLNPAFTATTSRAFCDDSHFP